MNKRRSLKRPLTIFPLLFHLATLLVSFVVLLAVAIRVDSGGPIADEQVTPVIANAISRRADGSLLIRMTPELARVRAQASDFWFVAEDDQGRSASFGQVPPHFRAFVGRLNAFSYAQLRGRRAPFELAAVIRREVAPAGVLTVLAHGKITELSLIVFLTSNLVLVPTFLILVLTSVIVTPHIVRRSLAGVSRIAQEAGQIDTDRRGRRLSEEHVPEEIVPLVRAVNDALRRLDEGYERQRRFIASAAHELRTPLAILLAKVEGAPASDRGELRPDVQRLATLAEQLLDIERLDAGGIEEELDLGVLVRGIVADLAPLLIASGRSIDLRVEEAARFRGDAGALTRVVTNLVQNAMEHGGRRVAVRVNGAAFEVEDDGPGIPPEERERVFEPFHRLRTHATGSGLGLNLVQQVVARHGGQVAILSPGGGGTIVRVELSRR